LVDFSGFAGEVIAAHVGGDDEVIFGELGKLRVPGVREFGEAMEKDHERASASFDVVQSDAVYVCVAVFQYENSFKVATGNWA